MDRKKNSHWIIMLAKSLYKSMKCNHVFKFMVEVGPRNALEEHKEYIHALAVKGGI